MWEPRQDDDVLGLKVSAGWSPIDTWDSHLESKNLSFGGSESMIKDSEVSYSLILFFYIHIK